MAETTQAQESPKNGPAPEGNEVLLRGATEVLDLVDSLARSLTRVRAAQARAARLRAPAFTLLSLARAAGLDGITVSEAAMRMGVRPQALSGQVSELVEEGLLEREVDAADGRARRLRATDEGARRLEMSSDLRTRVLKEVLTEVPSPNVARLVLGRLETAVSRALTEGGLG